MSATPKLQKRFLFNSLKERDGLICGICAGDLSKEWDVYLKWCETFKPKRNSINLTIDHKVPKSIVRPWEKGERIYDDLDNLQLAHATCNTKKGSTILL